MDKIMRYAEEYLKINIVFVLGALIYSFYKTLAESTNLLVLIGGIGILVTYLVNMALYRNDFYDKIKNFYFCQFTYLFIISLFFLSDDPYISVASMLMYIVFVIELLVVTAGTLPSPKRFLYGYLFFSTIGIIVNLFFKSFIPFKTILKIINFNVTLIAIYVIINLIIQELSYKINQQNKLIVDNEKARLELMEMQAIIKQDNVELKKQKKKVENANSTMNRVNAEMFIQNEILRYITATLDLDVLMELVTDAIIGAAGVDTCSLILYDVNSDEHYFKTKSNINENLEKEIKTAFAKGELDKYLKMNTSMVDSNVCSSNYPFLKNRSVGSLLIVPLIANKEPYGLLIAEQASKDTLTEESIPFFEGIGTQINIAVVNANIYTRMEEIAKRDSMTNLYNRGYLQRKLYALFDELKEKNEPITVTLFDIDRFKSINDTYGHLFGDEAIIMVAEKAIALSEKLDGIAGRYGGEEFVIIFPGKTIDQVYQSIELLHKEIKETPLFYQKDTVVHVDISIGITCYPNFGSHPEELLNRADNAMYYSKVHGRGRITIDSDALSE